MGLRPDLQAFKKWGQNFITDPALLDKLVRHVDPQRDDIMVEIGPGAGAMTRLFAPRVKHLHSIDIDPRMEPYLQAVQADVSTFTYEFADFLKWTPGPELASFRLMGNIPYYITSALILHAMDHHHQIQDVHFLMQKEVGKRLVAPHGSKQYGILSVYSALFARTEYLFDIRRTVFHPVPDVDSCFVRFRFDDLEPYEPAFEAQLRKVIRVSFNQRRKTLRNSLKTVLEARGVGALDFDLGLRPEQLHPQAFVELTRQILDS